MKKAAGEQPGHDAILIPIDPRMEDLVTAYLGRCRADVERIPGLLRGNDLEAVRALGDRMAGSGGAYGFSHVSRLGFEIERGARAGDHAAVEQVVDELRRYLASVRIVPLSP